MRRAPPLVAGEVRVAAEAPRLRRVAPARSTNANRSGTSSTAASTALARVSDQQHRTLRLRSKLTFPLPTRVARLCTGRSRGRPEPGHSRKSAEHEAGGTLHLRLSALKFRLGRSAARLPCSVLGTEHGSREKKRMMGLEPTTFCMASRRSSQLSYIRERGQYSPPLRLS